MSDRNIDDDDDGDNEALARACDNPEDRNAGALDYAYAAKMAFRREIDSVTERRI